MSQHIITAEEFERIRDDHDSLRSTLSRVARDVWLLEGGQDLASQRSHLSELVTACVGLTTTLHDVLERVEQETLAWRAALPSHEDVAATFGDDEPVSDRPYEREAPLSALATVTDLLGGAAIIAMTTPGTNARYLYALLADTRTRLRAVHKELCQREGGKRERRRQDGTIGVAP